MRSRTSETTENCKDDLGNLGKATTVTGRRVEGATKLVKLQQPFVPNQPGPNPMRDLMIAQGGDEAEKEFFKKIRQILENADEEWDTLLPKYSFAY